MLGRRSLCHGLRNAGNHWQTSGAGHFIRESCPLAHELRGKLDGMPTRAAEEPIAARGTAPVDSAAVAARHILEDGATFGRYKIKRRLGAGGMGEVYEATHTGLGKRVAIKALLPELAREPEVQVRFLREGESAARIQHPHVVDIYDVGTEDEVTFLVMEYLEGRDLADLLRERGMLPISEAVDIVLPVAAAVMAAHHEGVLHRDLKPANIFLAEGHHGLSMPKVLDFGISKLMTGAPTDALTTTGALIGTPFYMSPEQAAGSKVLDARSDQYSLGVILYQCVTGVRPFKSDSMYRLLHRIVQGEFVPPSSVNPSIPGDFERVVLTAMATKPDARYPTVKELGRALLPFAGSSLRARWEAIFSEQLTSNDLPSTYHVPPQAPRPAPLAEPITRNEPPSTFGSGTVEPARTGRGRWLLIAGALLIALAASIVLLSRGEQAAPIAESPPPPPPPPPPTAVVEPPAPAEFTVSISAEPADARLLVDGQTSALGHFEGSFVADGTPHRIEISHSGYQMRVLEFSDAAPSERTVVLEKRPNRKVKPTRSMGHVMKPPHPTPVNGANRAPILK